MHAHALHESHTSLHPQNKQMALIVSLAEACIAIKAKQAFKKHWVRVFIITRNGVLQKVCFESEKVQHQADYDAIVVLLPLLV